MFNCTTIPININQTTPEITRKIFGSFLNIQEDAELNLDYNPVITYTVTRYTSSSRVLQFLEDWKRNGGGF